MLPPLFCWCVGLYIYIYVTFSLCAFWCPFSIFRGSPFTFNQIKGKQQLHKATLRHRMKIVRTKCTNMTTAVTENPKMGEKLPASPHSFQAELNICLLCVFFSFKKKRVGVATVCRWTHSPHSKLKSRMLWKILVNMFHALQTVYKKCHERSSLRQWNKKRHAKIEHSSARLDEILHPLSALKHKIFCYSENKYHSCSR